MSHGTYRYDNARREDPEIRAEVERIHEARNALLIEAAQELGHIVSRMRELVLDGDDAIYSRGYWAVWHAYSLVSEDAEFRKQIGGETYIGNISASQLGAYVARELGK